LAELDAKLLAGPLVELRVEPLVKLRAELQQSSMRSLGRALCRALRELCIEL